MASVEMESLKKVMLNMMKQGFLPQFGGDLDPVRLREVIQGAQSRMPVIPGVTIKAEEINGVEVENVVSDGSGSDGVMIYIHGGGLICGNVQSSRGYASTLAMETGLPIWTLSYRLAPENTYPAAVEDCYAVYKEIADRNPGKPIFLIGESGGAYLSLVTALKARDEGIQIPAGVISYSAPIDMSGTINRVRPGNKDFTVTVDGMEMLGKMYCPDENLIKDPYVSPYFADFTGFPPLLLSWDESETLAPDSEALMEKAIAAGAEVSGKGYPDCFHAFATTGRGTPESTEVLEEMVAFVKTHVK